MPRPIASENEPPIRGNPDRKRVLNVLAQRRYRQRKRERLAALENLAGGSTTTTSFATLECIDASTNSTYNVSSSEESQRPEVASPRRAISSTSSNESSSHQSFDPRFQSFGISLPGFASPNTVSAWEEMEMPNSLEDSHYEPSLDETLSSPESANPYFNSQQTVSTFTWPHTSQVISFPEPVLSNDLEMDVPVLKTMRIGLRIIEMLGGLEHVYDLTSKWTMTGCDISQLPPSFQPTPTQLRVPHHPIIDMIPWPSLRTKLILMYAMPPALRPPNARVPDSILQIAHDIDDPAEGFIVNGPNGMSEDEWEIGGAFLKNWWWAVDQEIVSKTNAQRVKRGVPRLLLTYGN
jgi:hypothetical protein